MVRILLVFLAIMAAYCSSTVTEEPEPAVINIVKSSEAPQRICEADEVCYLGYVYVDPVDKSSTFRALQTWYVKMAIFGKNL